MVCVRYLACGDGGAVRDVQIFGPQAEEKAFGMAVISIATMFIGGRDQVVSAKRYAIPLNLSEKENEDAWHWFVKRLHPKNNP